MKKYYFSVEDNKLIDSDGAFSADERSRPQSTLGQKDTTNVQFVKNKTTPLVNYTKFLAGTTARYLVDIDYLNAGVLIPLGNTGWNLSSGAEYKKILSTKPDTVEFNGVDASEGTVGALSAGEWGYIELSTEIVVRLSDDADPSTKDDDFVQVLYINASATPLFIEASSDVFNLPNSWLDDDGVTLRDPDITAGEVSFFLNSNTVNFYNRLGGSNKSDGFAEIQFFEPSTALFFMKAKFNYTCTNRLLTSGEDPLELVGVDVYTKAESDARFVRQALSTAYPEQTSLLGTERFFLKDGATPKQATISTLASFVSIDNGSVAYVSKNGSDSTGSVGKPANPYLTIMGAVNACNALSPSGLNRFLVLINPGTYEEYINLDGKANIDLKSVGFGLVYISGAGGTGALLNLVNGGASSFFDMEDIFFLYTPSANSESAITSTFEQVDFKKCPVIVTDSNNYSFDVFDISSGLAAVIECSVIVTLTGTGVPSGEINVLKISGDTIFVNGLQLIQFTTSQSDGDINIISDGSNQPNSVSLTDVTIIVTAGYSGDVKFIKNTYPVVFGKIYITSKCSCIGGGTGDFYGAYNDSGGTSVITVQGTTFNCLGMANCYSGWSNGAGDTINFDFCSFNDKFLTGGAGSVHKIASEDSELRVSTEIVDENMLLSDTDPTNYTLRSLFNIMFSAGWVNGFGYTDNLDGSVDIDSGTCMIRSSDDEQAPVFTADVLAKSGIALVDNFSNFIYVDYNTGSPEIFTTTVAEDILGNENNKFEIWEIYREGTTLHVTDHKQRAKNIFSLIQKYLYTLFPIRYGGSGLKLANIGTRNISVTAGSLWVKLNEGLFGALDTSASGTFTDYYNISGVYVPHAGLTQWDNLSYDDGTDLVSMGTGKYSYKDFYAEGDGRLVMLYGEDQYNSTVDASEAPERSPSPGVLEEHALYIARIVFQQNNDTPISVIDKTEATAGAGGSSPTDHNDLSSLQGGAASEYYHATAAEYVKVQALVKNKFDATSAPTVSDDNTQGYAVGSRWIDVTNDIIYSLVDASTGSADWKNSNSFTMNRVTTSVALVSGADYLNLIDSSIGAITPLLGASPSEGDIYKILIVDDTNLIEISGNGNDIIDDSGNLTGLELYSGMTIAWDNVRSSYYITSEISSGGGTSSTQTYSDQNILANRIFN